MMRVILRATTLLALACGAAAQGNGRASGEGSRATRPAASRPAWPKLGSGEEEKLKGWIARLGHKEPGEASKAETMIMEIGPGAAPFLIKKLSDEPENLNADIERILGRLVSGEDAILLVPFLTDRRTAVRRYAAQRISLHATRDLKPILVSMRKDQDPELVFLAELALARIGDQSSLPALMSFARESWHKKGAEIRDAAAKLKGVEATEFLLEKLESKDLKTELAALRLLAVAGTKQSAIRIGLLLDSTNHLHKKEAINALRGIVEGEGPLDDLSVFQAIEMTKEWKEKLRGL